MSADRFEAFERLAANVRAGLPAIVRIWSAPVRAKLEILTRAAMDPKVDDDTFNRMIRQAAAELPAMMDDLDTTTLAEYLEASMGAAMANGLTAPRGGDSPPPP